jgi:hypothetical protein
MIGVSAHSVNECRVVSELEWQTNEVKAWLRQHDASLVRGEVAAGGRRQFDPAVVVLESGAPNHVLDVKPPTILQAWLASLDTFDPRHSRDAGGGKIPLS